MCLLTSVTLVTITCVFADFSDIVLVTITCVFADFSDVVFDWNSNGTAAILFWAVP